MGDAMTREISERKAKHAGLDVKYIVGPEDYRVEPSHSKQISSKDIRIAISGLIEGLNPNGR